MGGWTTTCARPAETGQIMLWVFLVLGVLALRCSSTPSTMTDEDFKDLSNELQGDVYLPGSAQYKAGATMKNTLYNSEFRAVAYVESSADVQKVLMFCKKFGLTPTIKSSGHDYIGRASGTGSFNIYLTRMKANSIRQDSSVDTGSVIDIEPGLSWGDIYKVVHDAGYVVIGGSAQTVSPGGYTQGGGHSPMSRKFGLGVDNCVGFVLVVHDGTIITLKHTGTGTIQRPGEAAATSFNDPELFWAVRGGGGGTFGVVTQYTYKVHPAPTGGFVQLVATFPIESNTQGDVGKFVFDKWRELVLSNFTDNWGGYLLTNAYNGPIKYPGNPYVKGTATFALLHYGGMSEASPLITEFERALRSPYSLYWGVNTFDTFWDYEKNVNDPTGFRVYVINRLLQEEDMRTPKLSEVLAALADVNDYRVSCTVTMLGGQMSSFSEASSAVSPHLRSSLGSLSCGVGWGDNDDENYFIDLLKKKYRDDLYTVGTGVYFNEPDKYLPDWKTEYWGSVASYDRLLVVKQQYDPNNTFWCYHCVGSDLVPSPYPDSAVSVRPMAVLLMVSVLWFVL